MTSGFFRAWKRKLAGLSALLLAALLLAACVFSAPVSAQSLCTPPVPPPPLDGAKATAEQLRDAIAGARGFIGKANLYESCLKDEIAAARARAAAIGTAKTDGQAEIRLAANRRLRDKVSAAAAAALDAYKKAHVD